MIALAMRRAPRSSTVDGTLVRAVLGAPRVLTLVVVASALRRMDLYVDAYRLTRLRVSVAAMGLWLRLVIVAGVDSARNQGSCVRLRRADGASAAAGPSGENLFADAFDRALLPYARRDGLPDGPCSVNGASRMRRRRRGAFAGV
ncbi:DUF4153 domain-containing protein [Streptomyces sp. NPDC002889]|uniref:DUF4153 domain-containing protein n=1 Tax=Streptomyces sp. NPDC002889 TaxID=3364669 RepID=UPI0036AA70E2